jgi:hypothetical protein
MLGIKPALVLCLANELFLYTPVVAASAPPDVIAIEAAAKSNDQSGAAYLALAGELDNQNGQSSETPTLILDKYQKAATADESAADRYNAAEKDWNQAADKYKAAADAIKGFNDAEATQLSGLSAERKRSADLSKQNAIKAYLTGSVEHDKGTIKSVATADKASETAAAAKDRDLAAQIK